jgi:hypothetical protein
MFGATAELPFVGDVNFDGHDARPLRLSGVIDGVWKSVFARF